MESMLAVWKLKVYYKLFSKLHLSTMRSSFVSDTKKPISFAFLSMNKSKKTIVLLKRVLLSASVMWNLSHHALSSGC